MRKLQIALLAALAGLGYVHAFGQLGKCNTEHITPIPLPMSEVSCAKFLIQLLDQYT